MKEADDVANFINSEFPDIKSLKHVKESFKKYRDKKSSLEKQLSLASSEVPTEIENAISNAEAARKRVSNLGQKKEDLHHGILDHVHNLQPLVEETARLTRDVKELEKLAKYLSCIVRVEDLSSQIQAALLTDDITKAVDVFDDLTSLYTTLHASQCVNMVNFAKETTLFWYRLLKDKIAREFEEILKSMKWPLVATTIKAPSVQNPAETRTRMEQLFKQLLQLHLPDSLGVEGQSTLPGFSKPLLLPLQLMVKPLRKRFKYHFHGKKQTNDLGKPEWYFTQVLSWIRDHRDFLEQRIQPLLNEAGKTSVDAKLEFMRGVVTLVMEKMLNDIPNLLYDEHQFSHLVDEALLFDRELRLSYNYPASLPGSLHVLTEGEAFEKWILIEKRFAIEKLDVMLSSPTAWESQYKDIVDVDDMKVPECGESFMTLMLTITDRYKPLPHPAYKLRFLDLQLELLDDFRVRLVQVMKDVMHNPLSPCHCSILNTVYYVAEVLREWSELVFFLQLQYYRNEFSSKGIKPSDVTSTPKSRQLTDVDLSPDISKFSEDLDEMSLVVESTVFEDMIQLFDRLRHDMLKNMVHHVFTDVRARSKPYRDDRWLSLPSQKDLTLGLSTTACEMLLVLKDHLLDVSKLISIPLFNQFWQKLAEKLNRFVYDEVILANKFNDGGAAQLHFDMTRNLFPLFGEYTQKPEMYFKDVKEACTLLVLNVGSALLLKDVLNTALHKPGKKGTKEDPKQTLHEVGLFKLTPEQAELILSLRVNLTV